jgi:hypothetical protein
LSGGSVHTVSSMEPCVSLSWPFRYHLKELAFALWFTTWFTMSLTMVFAMY